MSKSRARRTRKLRRKVRAVLKHGPDARPKHTSPGGRTGKIRAKQTPGK